MIKTAVISAFKTELLQELSDLADADQTGAEDRGTVELDQQSVGRLSRMDALQRQAMAEAHNRRRAARRQRIAAALARIDEGEFGYCQDCGEEIPEGRLKLDPTNSNCVSCASG